MVGEPVPPETVLHADMAILAKMAPDDMAMVSETPQWDAVATPPELRGGPLGVEVQGRACVVARLDDEVVLFEDRCLRRLDLEPRPR